MNERHEIQTVGIVGIGAIGSSWATLCIDRGLQVIGYDPDSAAGRIMLDTVARQLDREVPAHQIRFTSDLDGLAAADLIIEAGPERLELKQKLLARLDAIVPADVLLTSSTSSLTPTSLQQLCVQHPERVIVAHPFNPPHIMPLVEVVPGEQTSEEVVTTTVEVFKGLGRQPIVLRRELPGHVANRLQAALWREAYALVAEGSVSAADIDTAIAAGPGLRWALLGPFATQHLSGGPGGFTHIMDHFGAGTAAMFGMLRDPEWTPEFQEIITAAVVDEMHDVDQDNLARQRDSALLELLELKRRFSLDHSDDSKTIHPNGSKP